MEKLLDKNYLKRKPQYPLELVSLRLGASYAVGNPRFTVYTFNRGEAAATRRTNQVELGEFPSSVDMNRVESGGFSSSVDMNRVESREYPSSVGIKPLLDQVESSGEAAATRRTYQVELGEFPSSVDMNRVESGGFSSSVDMNRVESGEYPSSIGMKPLLDQVESSGEGVATRRTYRERRMSMDKNETSNLYIDVDFDPSHRKNTALHRAAGTGNMKMLKELRSNTPAWISIQNSKDETAFHIAARSGHVDVVKFLIDWAAETTDVKNGEILKVLTVGNMEGNTPLHEAVRNGHHSIVVVLLREAKAKSSDLLGSVNNAGESPLFMAVDVRASEIVGTILQKSEDPSSLRNKSPDGQTLLHRAILRADSKTMKIILQKLPDLVNEQDDCGRSPLHYAAASGAFAMVNQLLQLKPSTESFCDDNLATPAHMAAENGHLNVLKLFVKSRCHSVEFLNNHNQNILHVAAQNGHSEVVQYILKVHMTSDLRNETDKDGNTPLHLASAKLHSCTVSTLIRTGNVNARAINNNGETALDMARKFQLVSPSNEGTNVKQTQATPNKTSCTCEEKIEAKKQWTIVILKEASAKQAGKLEEILEQEDLIRESIRDKGHKEMRGYYIAMATMVGAATFTAALTLPGGIQSEGPDQGMAVLISKASFKAFIVADAIAATSSMTAAVILITSSWNDERNKWNLHFIALQLLWMSLAAMGLAFVTGLFTVLSPSMELAVMVCSIGCVFPTLLYLLGPPSLPGKFDWPLMDIIEKIKAKIYAFWILHTNK